MSEQPRPTVLPLIRQRGRLVQARHQRGWSQQELADLLGTTPLNVSRWERALTTPNPYFRQKLCALFDLNEIELGLRPHPTPLQDEEEHPKETALFDPFLPLPAAVPLVGRASLLEDLKRQVLNTRSMSLLALYGLPGVGKTALALELAYDMQLREHYPDGLLWAGLGPQPHLVGLLSHWGHLLGVSDDEASQLHTPEDWARTLRAAIGSRRLLFLLDDAWSLEHALTCQVGGPQCTYVLTTRLPQIAQSFALSQASIVDVLEAEDGLELLRQLAPWAVEQAPDALRELIQAVGGLPLALSLLGHTLRQQTYNQQPRRLQAVLERLQSELTRLQLAFPGVSGQIGGGHSLEMVVSSSAEHLSAEASQAWAALSVLPARPHSFGERAALEVTGVEVETLDELSDAGILEAVGTGRYTLHQVLADYGRAQLGKREAEVRQRLISYSQRYAEEHREHNAALEEEASMLIVALEACEQESAAEALLRLTLVLAHFWRMCGDYSQAELWLPQAAEAAHLLQWSREEARVRIELGEIAMERGDYELGLLHYEQGLALARQVSETDLVCVSLRGIGWVARKRGEYEQAEQVLREGLTLARQQGLVQQQAKLLGQLGVVMELQGNLEEKRACTQEALQLARQEGDQELTCDLLTDLGVLHHRLGDYPQAARYFRDVLTLARQHGYRSIEGLLLSNLGGVTYLGGDYIQAERYAQEGLGLARQTGNPERMCTALILLGEIAWVRGDYIQAERYAQEGLSLAHQIGNPEYTDDALIVLGGAALARGDDAQTEQVLQEGLSLAHQIGNPDSVCRALLNLGKQALFRREDEQAEQYLQEGLHLARDVGLSAYRGQTLNILGEIALARGNNEQAEQFLQEALGLARQLHLRPLLCQTLYRWGTLTLQRGQFEEATASFEEMLETVPEGAKLEVAQAHFGLARVDAMQGQNTQARQRGTQALAWFEALGHCESAQVRSWLASLDLEA